MKEIKSLTGLRGWAAIWVCAFHYTLQWPASDGWLLSVVRLGNYGVSVFFVLSGFILSSVYRGWFDGTSAKGFREYMRHRLARVYPLHVLMLLVTAALIAAGVQPLDRYDTVGTFVLNLLLLHGWGYPDSVSWNSASWTISVELFAYLLFPAILWGVRASVLVLLLAGAVAVYATPLYLEFLQRSGVDLGAVQFGYGIYLVRYLCMFVIGMVTARVAEQIAPRIQAAALFDVTAIAGLAWILGRGVLQGHTTEIPYGAALLVLGLSRDAGIGRLVFGNRVSVLLGQWSYALYLSHIAVIFIAWRVAAHFDIAAIDLPLLPLIALALGVSAALHYGFERPMREWLRGAQSTAGDRAGVGHKGLLEDSVAEPF